MSAWLVTLGIPAGLLTFYPLVLVLTWLRPIRSKPQLLKHAHLAGWGLTLVLFGIFVKWHLSLRGQWLDALPVGLAWLAAGSYFWLRRRQLGWPARLYFGGWFAYPGALALAYLADRIFFVLVSLPLLAFWPTTTYYSSPTLLIREPPSSFLAAPRVQLLEPVGLIWERHEGFAYGAQFGGGTDSILAAHLLPGYRLDSVAVRLATPGGERVVRFSR